MIIRTETAKPVLSRLRRKLMNLKATLAFACIYLAAIFVLSANALDIPRYQGYVNDNAGMISPQAKTQLENELRAFEQSDSTQIVILTISSLQGDSIENFSIKLAEAWKAGQKGKDNGIILIVSKNDRKMRIEVGKGLEGKLTDLLAGRILSLVINPKFKRGDFDGGFISGAHALIDATRGEFKTDQKRIYRKQEHLSRLMTFLIFGTVVILIISSISRSLGGAAGAIGLPSIVYSMFSLSNPVFLVILGILGLLAGLFLPSLFSSGGNRGGFWPGGGYYGGGGFGGGSDIGGFGGFSGGGGDFGGGGASGDW